MTPYKMPGGMARPQGTAEKLRHGVRQGCARCRGLPGQKWGLWGII